MKQPSLVGRSCAPQAPIRFRVLPPLSHRTIVGHHGPTCSGAAVHESLPPIVSKTSSWLHPGRHQTGRPHTFPYVCAKLTLPRSHHLCRRRPVLLMTFRHCPGQPRLGLRRAFCNPLSAVLVVRERRCNSSTRAALLFPRRRPVWASRPPSTPPITPLPDHRVVAQRLYNSTTSRPHLGRVRHHGRTVGDGRHDDGSALHRSRSSL